MLITRNGMLGCRHASILDGPGEALLCLAGTIPTGYENVKYSNSIQHSHYLRQQVQRRRHAQNLKGDRLQYRRQKTEGASSVLIDIPVHPELRKVLEQLPRDKLTFLETRGGRSRTANGLGTAMRKWCDDAGLPKCAAHGLRKACATRLAEAGATEREIMAWTGHTSPTMVQVYAGKARRGMLADHGFEKLIKNEQGSRVDEPNAKGSTQ